MEAESAPRPPVVVALLSFAALAAGLATASLFGAEVTNAYSIARLIDITRDPTSGTPFRIGPPGVEQAGW